ncbi:MAG TPA: CerR family C-terminal domain-containing protein [Stellaceae bacterium]|nr:CerR family C-terminal domain-containing protein [Stellaceae bacterium]
MIPETMAMHYRPGTPGRGEDTARRILLAAIEVFADEGYEGASTRSLASHAGVNAPAIQYYFGSKEGLYRAVIAHIAHLVETRLEPLAQRIETALGAQPTGGQPSQAELTALLLDLLDGFLDLCVCRGIPEAAALLIARAEIENAAALDVLQQAVLRLAFGPAISLVARLLGLPNSDEEVKIRTFTIFGQAMVFKKRATKMCACPVLGWAELDDPQIKIIAKILREQTEAILRAATEKKS